MLTYSDRANWPKSGPGSRAGKGIRGSKSKRGGKTPTELEARNISSSSASSIRPPTKKTKRVLRRSSSAD